MLLHGGETVNDKKQLDGSTLGHRSGFLEPEGHQSPGYLRSNPGQIQWNLEGRAMSALSTFGKKARTISNPVWLHRVEHQRAIIEPPGKLNIKN